MGLRSLAPLAALLLLSCAELMTPPRVGPAAPTLSDPVAERDYQEVLARWTRRAEIYKGLDAEAFFAATLQGMRFREARVARVAAFRSLPATESEPLLSAERKAHEEALEFVIGLQATERRYDDLARPSSIWSLAVATEAGEAAPLSIERLPRGNTELFAIYPYLGPFWTGYRVRFPRTFPNGAQVLPMGAGWLELRLSGPVGQAKLRWDFEAPAESASTWP